MSLYAISAEINAVLDAMLVNGIDSPEANDALNEHLAGLDAALESKAENYAGFIRELELRAKARKEEADRIRALATADAALADRLKERLKAAMEASGKLKIETNRFRLSVSNNGGAQPLDVDASHMNAWDPPFRKIITEPNREAIRIALENGATIPGCSLRERGTSLRIK